MKSSPIRWQESPFGLLLSTMISSLSTLANEHKLPISIDKATSYEERRAIALFVFIRELSELLIKDIFPKVDNQQLPGLIQRGMIVKSLILLLKKHRAVYIHPSHMALIVFNRQAPLWIKNADKKAEYSLKKVTTTEQLHQLLSFMLTDASAYTPPKEDLLSQNDWALFVANLSLMVNYLAIEHLDSSKTHANLLTLVRNNYQANYLTGQNFVGINTAHPAVLALLGHVFSKEFLKDGNTATLVPFLNPKVFEIDSSQGLFSFLKSLMGFGIKICLKPETSWCFLVEYTQSNEPIRFEIQVDEYLNSIRYPLVSAIEQKTVEARTYPSLSSSSSDSDEEKEACYLEQFDEPLDPHFIQPDEDSFKPSILTDELQRQIDTLLIQINESEKGSSYLEHLAVMAELKLTRLRFDLEQVKENLVKMDEAKDALKKRLLDKWSSFITVSIPDSLSVLEFYQNCQKALLSEKNNIDAALKNLNDLVVIQKAINENKDTNLYSILKKIKKLDMIKDLFINDSDKEKEWMEYVNNNQKVFSKKIAQDAHSTQMSRLLDIINTRLKELEPLVSKLKTIDVALNQVTPGIDALSDIQKEQESYEQQKQKMLLEIELLAKESEDKTRQYIESQKQLSQLSRQHEELIRRLECVELLNGFNQKVESLNRLALNTLSECRSAFTLCKEYQDDFLNKANKFNAILELEQTYAEICTQIRQFYDDLTFKIKVLENQQAITTQQLLVQNQPPSKSQISAQEHQYAHDCIARLREHVQSLGECLMSDGVDECHQVIKAWEQCLLNTKTHLNEQLQEMLEQNRASCDELVNLRVQFSHLAAYPELDSQLLLKVQNKLTVFEEKQRKRERLFKRFLKAKEEYLKTRSERFFMKDKINRRDLHQRAGFLSALTDELQLYQQSANPLPLFELIELGLRGFKGIHLSSILCQLYTEVARQSIGTLPEIDAEPLPEHWQSYINQMEMVVLSLGTQSATKANLIQSQLNDVKQFLKTTPLDNPRIGTIIYCMMHRKDYLLGEHRHMLLRGFSRIYQGITKPLISLNLISDRHHSRFFAPQSLYKLNSIAMPCLAKSI